MTIRPATAADIPLLVALGRGSFTDAFGHLYHPQDLATFLDEHRAPGKFAEAVAAPDTAVWVAEAAGALLGYCLIEFSTGFDQRPEPRPARPCLLGQLYCAGSATGRGIGAALMDRALAEARTRGCDAVQLSVYSENFGAQRFYERYGFAKVADIDFWVGRHRDDEFLYELRL